MISLYMNYCKLHFLFIFLHVDLEINLIDLSVTVHVYQSQYMLINHSTRLSVTVHVYRSQYMFISHSTRLSVTVHVYRSQYCLSVTVHVFRSQYMFNSHSTCLSVTVHVYPSQYTFIGHSTRMHVTVHVQNASLLLLSVPLQHNSHHRQHSGSVDIEDISYGCQQPLPWKTTWQPTLQATRPTEFLTNRAWAIHPDSDVRAATVTCSMLISNGPMD